MFLGVWYLQLQVNTEIHLLFSLCDDAGYIYQSFFVLHALVTGFPIGVLLIQSAPHKTQGHNLEFVPRANDVIF